MIETLFEKDGLKVRRALTVIEIRQTNADGSVTVIAMLDSLWRELIEEVKDE